MGMRVTQFRGDQSNFSFGQLDPRLAARTDYDGYYKGAQSLRNCLVIPQGGIQRRFGTLFVDELTTLPNRTALAFSALTVEISTFVFDDNAIYLMLWEATSLKIYLENILVATLATQFAAEDIQHLRFSQVEDRLIIANEFFQTQQLIRSANAANAITGFSAVTNTLTITNALTVGQVLPVQFTTSGTFPTTFPQVFDGGRTYFALVITANTVQIFSDSDDAAADINFYIISSAGTGASLIVLNTWAISNIGFTNVPAYDFGLQNYSTINFTPSAVSGNITLTASAPAFTAAMAAGTGGLFSGNGGIMRITGFGSNMSVTGFTIESFTNTNAILGALAFLGEPAWSTLRGWPRCVSFFQNRLVFAGSPSIINGVWLSAVNEVFTFDDSQTLPDSAISYYPSSNQNNYMQAITAASSLLFHTNTGNYSTPVSVEVPFTPTNFVLTEHNKDGVSKIQPVFIDNQIMYVDRSINNIKNMIWEFTQSKYVLNNISIPSSNLIKNPVDMAAFTDPGDIDGYYVIVINTDGTLAILQTLKEEGLRAWMPADTDTEGVPNSVGMHGVFPLQTDNFIKVASSINDCWFIVLRNSSIPILTAAIIGFSSANNTLTANATGVLQGLIQFTTTGTLPVTVPQINTTSYFYATTTDGIHFNVYSNASNAALQINEIQILSAGVNTNVISWQQQLIYTLEEIDFSVLTDSSRIYIGLNSATVAADLTPLNSAFVSIVADGFVIPNQQVFNGTITLPQVSQNVIIGLPYLSVFSPLPFANIQNGINLYSQKHIRGFYIYYYLSLGIQIQGYDIPALAFDNVVLDAPPPLVTGVYLFGIMEEWDPFSYTITISQANPLPMTILGISYDMEV
jgi:hypothetical protein